MDISPPTRFPPDLGVRLANPFGARVGVLRLGSVGPARLWDYRDDGLKLERPAASGARWISVLAQVEGHARFEAAGRSCELGPGGVAFLEGPFSASIETVGTARQVGVELPLATVRFPSGYLAGRGADGSSPTVQLLSDALRTLWDAAPSLDVIQGEAALTAIAALARVATGSLLADRSPSDVLLDRATEVIERESRDPGLSAQAVAQAVGVSRRHLDRISVSSTGRSVDERIRDHRLDKAASLLEAGAAGEIGVYGVALECGFRGASHFSRSFRARFGVAPSRWSGPAAELRPLGFTGG
ncbi:helix-turn-helix domain-containing protein [Rubrivirga sp.]|uniref:helix-turn-helix domain-containing protein n=1 Tax=Rubrivirga sp. TaxID=1885344 RepID=UPI003C73502F